MEQNLSKFVFPRRELWTYSLSIALQNLLILIVSLLDNIMLGSYAEEALAGATLANQVQFIVQMTVAGLCEGLVIMLAQAMGGKRQREYSWLYRIAMLSSIILSALFFFIMMFYPQMIFQLLSTDKQVLNQALLYTQYIRFTYPAFIFTQVLLALMRCFGIVNIAYLSAFISLLLNGALNYMFIFGRWGAPRLGIVGAASATLVARYAALLLVLVTFIWGRRKQVISLSWHLDASRSDELELVQATRNTLAGRKYFYKFLLVTTPNFIAQFLWGLSTFLQLAVLGGYGKTVIVGNSVAVNYSQIITVVIYGLASGAQVIVGKVIGEGNVVKLVDYAGKLQRRYLVVAVISALLLLLSHLTVPWFYHSLSLEALRRCKEFLFVQALCCLGQGYQVPTDFSLVRATGNTMFPLKLNFVTGWIIGLPIAFYLSSLGVSPVWVFLVIRSDQLIKAPIIYAKVKHYLSQVQRDPSKLSAIRQT